MDNRNVNYSKLINLAKEEKWEEYFMERDKHLFKFRKKRKHRRKSKNERKI